MSKSLWPYLKKKKLEKELRQELASDTYQHYLAQHKNGKYMGFITLSIRSDPVEEATTSPVGYIEGIFVKPKYRKRGVARALVKKAESWTMDHGFTELGSDTELVNKKSQKFHKHVGFNKSDTIVHFIKKLKS